MMDPLHGVNSCAAAEQVGLAVHMHEMLKSQMFVQRADIPIRVRLRMPGCSDVNTHNSGGRGFFRNSRL